MNDSFDIYLRCLCEADAKISWKWRNDEEIWRNTGSSPDRYITEEMELDWIRKALLDKSTRRYAICLKEKDQYIGNVYLTDINGDSAVEQIFIGEKELWGKGIATRARAALYEIAKKEFGIVRIESHIRTRNIASIKSINKLGFNEISRNLEWVIFEKYL